TAVSILHNLAIGIDRYCCLRNVNYIVNTRTPKLMIVTICAIWVLCISVMALPFSFGADSRNQTTKEVNGKCIMPVNSKVNSFVLGGLSYIPLIGVCIIYALIYV